MSYTKEDQRVLLSEQAASGMSVAEFSRERGVSAKAMYGWQRKEAERVNNPEQRQFTRVQCGHTIRIELSSGIKLKVALESLKAVLKELGS